MTRPACVQQVLIVHVLLRHVQISTPLRPPLSFLSFDLLHALDQQLLLTELDGLSIRFFLKSTLDPVLFVLFCEVEFLQLQHLLFGCLAFPRSSDLPDNVGLCVPNLELLLVLNPVEDVVLLVHSSLHKVVELFLHL